MFGFSEQPKKPNKMDALTQARQLYVRFALLKNAGDTEYIGLNPYVIKQAAIEAVEFIIALYDYPSTMPVMGAHYDKEYWEDVKTKLRWL